jgi:hypothetical protein
VLQYAFHPYFCFFFSPVLLFLPNAMNEFP